MLGDGQIREKRGHPREPCFMAVDYVTQDRAYKDFIQNISRGGVFIETRVPFFVGERVSLAFMPPEYQKPIKIIGEVVRTSSHGIGMKYKLNMDLETKPYKTTNTKKLVWRRKRKRYPVRDGGFTLLNKPHSILGKIIDINTKGLSFSYAVAETFVPESFELDIVFLDGGFYLPKVPFKTVFDLQISKETRQCGIVFGQLTDSQLSQLELLIQNHTKGQFFNHSLTFIQEVA